METISTALSQKNALWQVYNKLSQPLRTQVEESLKAAGLLEFWQNEASLTKYDLRAAPEKFRSIFLALVPAQDKFKWVDEFTSPSGLDFEAFVNAAYNSSG